MDQGEPGNGKVEADEPSSRVLPTDFKDHIIVAYIFNAQGGSFENTRLDMLPSLMYQLLEEETSIYERFLPLFCEKWQKHKAGEWEWRSPS